MAAEVRHGWWVLSSMLSSEEVETAEPRLPDAGELVLSPPELADEFSDGVTWRLRLGLGRKLVQLYNLRNLLPLECLSPSDDPLCVDTDH